MYSRGMTQRRQFLQAAAVTPLALGAVPYVRTKPSWYLEPEDRIMFYMSGGEKHMVDWPCMHRETRQYHSLQDPSVNWSTSMDVEGIVSCLLRRFDKERWEASVGDLQRAKIFASSFWDFKADLNEPVAVSVNRGITYVTAADLLEWQDIAKHPKLQFSKEPRMSIQAIHDYNKFRPQPFKVDSTVFDRDRGIAFDVMEVGGSEMWLSIGSTGSKPMRYHTPDKQPRGMHVSNLKNWWVIPESILNKGHVLQYGDFVIPTLAAHRREPLESREVSINPSVYEDHRVGMSAHRIDRDLDKTSNTVFMMSEVEYSSDELIFLGHDPRPQVIWDDLEVSA